MEQDGITVDQQQLSVSERRKDSVYPTTASPNGAVVPEGSGDDSSVERHIQRTNGVVNEPLRTEQHVTSLSKHAVDHATPPEASEEQLQCADVAVTPPLVVDESPPSDGIGTKLPIQPSCDTTASTTTSAPVSSQLGIEATVDENLDELVGLGDNVIVERSPGGRYVRFMEKLGSGASKDVYRAYDTQEGIEVAWNVVNLQGIPKTDRNRIVNEVRLLEQLSHKNIISFHGSWVNRERQEVIFITEILSSGTLKSFIRKVQVIRWKIAKRWAVQILNGLEYLHSRDPLVIHRDLKCENIFINGASGDLRIGDFGLSTLYRNGKVRSVLGTPEFMAPDMYEETSYDEKVDIYAFGMCLLEIFTKEIPYAECSNPAQIYKKVSAGEPPEVLSRLRSRHAREFVELCLGYKDETTGKYIRPTASELLKHSFLEKRASDDDEVEVEPPLREKQIIEEGESQSMSPQVSGAKSPAQSNCGKVTMATSNCKSQLSSTGAATSGEKESHAPSHFRGRSNGSFDDDDDECDRFEQMPESEINIRNVKVFMGRGQELKEDVSDPPTVNKLEVEAIIGQQMAASSTTSPLTTSCTSVASNTTELRTNGLYPNVTFFPIAAGTAASGDVSSQATEVRQFVVTLPLEGQTQNVQFDFHLVNVDPVQVANEMVTELGLPADAAPGIAAIIRSLASEARGSNRVSMPPSTPSDHQPPPGSQQNPRQQLQHGPTEANQQQSGQATALPQVILQPSSVASQNYAASTASVGVPQDIHVESSAASTSVAYQQTHHPVAVQFLLSHNSVPYHALSVPPNHIHHPLMTSTAPSFVAQPLQGVPNLRTTLPHNPTQPVAGVALVLGPPECQTHPLVQVRTAVGPSLPLPYNSSQSTPSVLPVSHSPHPSLIPVAPPLVPPVPMQVPVPSQTVPSQTLQTIQTGNVDLQGNVNTSAFQRADSSNQPPIAPLTETFNAHIISSKKFAQRTQPSPLASIHVHHSNSNLTVSEPTTGLSPMMQSLNGNTASLFNAPASMIQQPKLSPLVSPLTIASKSVFLQNTATAHLAPTSMQNTPETTSNDLFTASQYHNTHMNAYAPILMQDDEKASSLSTEGEDGELLSEDESMMSDELRKLDEDYQKNLIRTKKVFDSRMDNLQRSLVEREVQHLRTLEKHEKDRVAFERRVQQEELEHTRRIEQLQREWDEKRDRLARQKQLGGLRSRKPSTDGMSLSPAFGSIRSHSTSPINQPDLLSAAAATTPLSLENLPTRLPLIRDSSAPKQLD